VYQEQNTFDLPEPYGKSRVLSFRLGSGLLHVLAQVYDLEGDMF
jgi:hypothetical protein